MEIYLHNLGNVIMIIGKMKMYATLDPQVHIFIEIISTLKIQKKISLPLTADLIITIPLIAAMVVTVL